MHQRFLERMENKLKKRVKLVEFNNDISAFIRNMIYPIEILDVKQENDVVTIYGKDTNSRAMIIGRERQNINYLSDIVKRYFSIKEIKVV